MYCHHLVNAHPYEYCHPTITYLPPCVSYLTPSMSYLTPFAGAASVEGDELMCIFEDLAGRSQLNQGLTVYATQPPAMREGVCVPRGNNGYTTEEVFSLVRGKIHDIRESCLSIHR